MVVGVVVVVVVMVVVVVVVVVEVVVVTFMQNGSRMKPFSNRLTVRTIAHCSTQHNRVRCEECTIRCWECSMRCRPQSGADHSE